MPILGCNHFSAAWWSCVVEPEDFHARALRERVGEDEAIAWAQAESPGPLPSDLYGQGRRWEETWERWHPRVLVANPQAEIEHLHSCGGHLLIPSDPTWPHAFGDLGPSEPIALWVRGQVSTRPRVAIVGARAATAHGERCAQDMSCDLAQAGITVISGGAFGIDIAAHRGALAGKGATIAVMAGGLGSVYPLAHRADFEEIVTSGGALISECPTSWRPARWRFLGRNRLIAALAQASVVVEASARSGALATARRAMTLGRPVGAVPGPITSTASIGCHDLIRNGATLVRDATEVAELLDPFTGFTQGTLFGDPVEADTGPDSLTALQRRVWEALPKRSVAQLSRLVRAAGLSEKEVLTSLAELELLGFVNSSTRGWQRRPA